ncbi:MAG: pyridoxal phosphate-dependent aminotransferase [Promethearchaeota archaeon]
MTRLAFRTKEIKPFIVMTLLERAKELEQAGKDIIHMEIGEPDFATPEPVQDAALKACKAGKTHYTHSLGMLELREAISAYKKRTRGISVDPETEIMVTAGSSPCFLMVFGTIIEPGDEVIITDPGYPCYENFVRFFGGKPVFLPITESNRFILRVEDIRQLLTPKTKAIILNSPANPTGQVIPEKTLHEIADLALDNDIIVISDEIYAELTYSENIAPSISEIPEMKDNSIIIDGFSKFWAMTGWRVGYMIAPSQILLEMNKINQNFLICAPSVSQAASIAALDTVDETKEKLRVYKKRRDYTIKRINEVPDLSVIPPSGAFYAFVNIKSITKDSLKFSFDLLENAYVATTPGIGFGKNGKGHVRFSFTTDIENIKEAFNRLEEFLK